MAILLLPSIRFNNDSTPIPILLSLVVILRPAKHPIPVLSIPLVTFSKANEPIAVFPNELLFVNALYPMAVSFLAKKPMNPGLVRLLDLYNA
jgi:hypothetical protein